MQFQEYRHPRQVILYPRQYSGMLEAEATADEAGTPEDGKEPQ